MEKQYYGIMGKKGRIEIPEKIKKETGIEKNDVIRICTLGNLIILEKVNLKDKDISKKIESMLDIECIPLETFQSYVLTAIKEMKNDELKELIGIAEFYLNN